MIGLKFVFSRGHFLSVGVTEDEARGIIQQFINNPKSSECVGKVSSNGAWTVRLSDVTYIHTVDLSELQQAPTQPQQQIPFRDPKFPYLGVSGIG